MPGGHEGSTRRVATRGGTSFTEVKPSQDVPDESFNNPDDDQPGPGGGEPRPAGEVAAVQPEDGRLSSSLCRSQL